MSQKLQKQKRVTKQIRISEELHRLIKLESVRSNTTLSKLADEIMFGYFDKKNKK